MIIQLDVIVVVGLSRYMIKPEYMAQVYNLDI